MPANWPSVLAQRKGNNYKLSHLLLVTSFFRDFSSRSMHSLDIKENLFSLVSLDREFIDSCRKLYQKKINLLLPLKEITQIHIKNEIFPELTLKYSNSLGNLIHCLSWVIRYLDAILHTRAF